MIFPVDESNLLAAGRVHSLSWQESHRSFCPPTFVAERTPERQSCYLREKMGRGSRVFLLVEDGEPMGVISVTGSLIEDLYVLPRHQRRGYGTQLLRHVIPLCDGQPTLWILENNHRAKSFYEAFGFIPTGRVNQEGKLSELEYVLP